MYTAELKNPVAEPLASKRAKVDLVLEQLALGGCRRVQIGNSLSRGICGARSARPLRLFRCLGQDSCRVQLKSVPGSQFRMPAPAPDHGVTQLSPLACGHAPRRQQGRAARPAS